MLILHLFIYCVVIKFVTNLFRLLATDFYYYLFKNKDKGINQYCRSIGNLFHHAGTQRKIIVSAQYFMKELYRDEISNHLTDDETYAELCEIFEQTMGVYKYRLRQTFYPSYWIAWPLTFLALFDINFGKIGSAIAGVAFWLITFVAEHYLEELLGLHSLFDVLSILDNLLK